MILMDATTCLTSRRSGFTSDHFGFTLDHIGFTLDHIGGCSRALGVCSCLQRPDKRETTERERSCTLRPSFPQRLARQPPGGFIAPQHHRILAARPLRTSAQFLSSPCVDPASAPVCRYIALHWITLCYIGSTRGLVERHRQPMRIARTRQCRSCEGPRRLADGASLRLLPLHRRHRPEI